MPEHPLLVLPRTEVGEKPTPPRGVSQLRPLTPARQGRRVGPKFDRLKRTLDSPRGEMSLRNDPSSIAPERALVFEVAGSIGDIYAAVQRIEGLEFLADEDAEFEPDEDFAEIDTRKGREGEPRMDKAVGGRLYLAMPDVTAIRQLLGLWERWQREQDLGRGFTPWRNVFAHLREVRPWGPQDRIPEESIEYWREKLGRAPGESVRTEVELWFRGNPQKRQEAFARFQAIVTASDGVIVDHAVIEEIGYEGALIDLPAGVTEQLVEREDVQIAICDDVMFLRPQSTAEFPVETEAVEEGEEPTPAGATELPPIAALLDGMPVQAHRLLTGRLVIDDPDNLEAMSVVGERTHGTQMASLILHGDRNRDDPLLSRSVYVRPVLYAPGGGRREHPQRDRLLIDVIYRAVKRMKEGDEEGEATAPEVFLVNLSLGDENRPFAGPMSPWAKLLDMLSERFGILFLVSAGNVKSPLPVPGFSTWTAFEDASIEDRERAILQGLSEQKSQRTLLSPAEGLNVVTVGAWHEDSVPDPHQDARAIDPFSGSDLPNVSSALGLGHRKVIKPELHLPGGRERLTFLLTGRDLVVGVAEAGRQYGLKAAIPDAAGALDREGLTNGTSAATALATRAAHRLFEALLDRDGGSLHADMDPAFYAVVIKALLIHRAGWGEKAALLEQLYGPHGPGKYVERRDNIARVMGYGRPIIEEAMACAPHRATMVGYGEVSTEGAVLYRIPLPPSLEGLMEPRAVTVTLAWFSPVNPRHQAYRRAKLEAGAVTKLDTAFGVSRASGQPSDKSVPRGTAFHTRYTGEKAVPFVDDGHVLLRVWCREQGGTLDQTIRYGLAVTIEAGETIPVYEEIRARLGIPVGVAAGA